MATSKPPDVLPKPAHCSELFLATLALKSTCILNLKPSNYLYLQRNGKIDFAIVMQRAAVAGVAWSASKNRDPRACPKPPRARPKPTRAR